MCHTRAATIGMLVDDVLLEIFEFYRNRGHLPPCHVWNWDILVHVCRRWRKIIFDSPRRLNLRLLCTYETPVRKHLGIWPAFPIDLQLDSLVDLRPKDEDNAIAALQHRDRVTSVRLFGTGSQMEKMATVMQEPFPVLTCLYMRSRCKDASALTAGFLGGSAPHLQEITLHRIPCPALPILLLSTSDLVTLNLFEVPMLGYIPPKRMAVCLAALPRLKVFAITFPGTALRPDRICPPPVTRPVLPALTSFEFQGAFEYLEDFVAQIDSPQLELISIIYWNQLQVYNLPFTLIQVSDFINRSMGPELTPNRHARIHFQYDRVTFTLSRDYETYQGCDRRSVAITLSHKVFSWLQPSDMARVLGQYSAALCTVVHLEFDAELEGSYYSAYDVEWLHLLRYFPVMQTLHVSLELAAPVSLALEDITAEMITEVLPSLGLICLEGKPASSHEKIVAIRRFSDHPITVAETIEEFKERVKSYVGR
jgi:hypothetical protein